MDFMIPGEENLGCNQWHPLQNEKSNLQKNHHLYQYQNLKSTGEKVAITFLENVPGVLGVETGAITGMCIGSVVPGIGTTLGLFAGGLYGYWATRSLEKKWIDLDREREIERNKNSPEEAFKQKFINFSQDTTILCALSLNFMKEPVKLSTSDCWVYEKEVLVKHVSKFGRCPATEETVTLKDFIEDGEVLCRVGKITRIILTEGSFARYFTENERPFMEKLNEDSEMGFVEFMSRRQYELAEGYKKGTYTLPQYQEKLLELDKKYK